MLKVISRTRSPHPNPQSEKTLTQLAQALASSLDGESIFREFVNGIRGKVTYDRILIRQVDPKGRISRLFFRSSIPGDSLGDVPTPSGRGQGVTKRVIREKRPLIRKDTRAEAEFKTDRQLSRIGIRSYMVLPLIHRTRVVGTLQVASKRARAYSQKDLQFLEPVAGWLALAMENSRQFHETHRLLEKQIQLSEEMRKRNEELQRATEYKTQFMARMSHEIRTPLGVLMGFLDILGSANLGPLNQEQKSAVDRMLVQSRRLQKMIDDVLNLSQIEEGTIPMEISTFSLQTVVESIQTLTDDLRRKHPLNVIWDVDPDLPHLTTDAPKLEEILQNLVENAFKYTPEGEVRIGIKNLRESRSVEFIVEDTGRGIAPEDIPKVFEGFHQIDATTSSRGVGLGLTIVKRYLDLMKGEICVRSEPGRGSTFRVTLPYNLDG